MTPTAAPERTPLPVLAPTARTGAGIDYELFLDCVHCGLCTSACPTYVELGTEMDSPRGRIYLMRAVTDGRLELTDEVRRHLDLLGVCRLYAHGTPAVTGRSVSCLLSSWISFFSSIIFSSRPTVSF